LINALIDAIIFLVTQIFLNSLTYVTRQLDHDGMHGLSSHELSFPKKQETEHQSIGDVEVLQVVQEAHRAQRNQEIN
jgi:hypothetical protein